jgi:hypothetical protein
VIRCTIGVFAHNEMPNVGRTLDALLTQELSTVAIEEIIVMASGCTDGTVEFAQALAIKHPIIRVEVEVERSGKAAAVRHLISMARGEVIVFVGADTLPAHDAIEHLLRPFADPQVGMTGARVIPLNAPTTFLGFAVQLLWRVHHHLALRKPKLGELVACRNTIADFPRDTATDDLALEALVVRQGYRLVYAPMALVFNRGPQIYRDFVLQRRRIFAGELRIALKYRYLSSSLSARHVLPLALDAMRTHPRLQVWTMGVMALDLWSRLLGSIDAMTGREPVVWQDARSTKALMMASDPVTLVSLQWAPDRFSGSKLLHELRRMPRSIGSMFWYDLRRGEILVGLTTSAAAVEWLKVCLAAADGAGSVQVSGIPQVPRRSADVASPATPADDGTSLVWNAQSS